MKALSAIVVALGTAMAVLGLVRPSEAATAINPNNVKLPALLGSIFFDLNHTSGSWEACEGLSHLEGDTEFVPYGMNETGYAQFAALSSYDPNRKCVVAYGYKTTDTSTNVLTFDAELGQLVGSPVWVPVVSYEFPGVGIRMSHDHERKRTIITGPMESYGTSHGFYVVGDGHQESKDLGFTLEQIAPWPVPARVPGSFGDKAERDRPVDRVFLGGGGQKLHGDESDRVPAARREPGRGEAGALARVSHRGLRGAGTANLARGEPHDSHAHLSHRDPRDHRRQL